VSAICVQAMILNKGRFEEPGGCQLEIQEMPLAPIGLTYGSAADVAHALGIRGQSVPFRRRGRAAAVIVLRFPQLNVSGKMPMRRERKGLSRSRTSISEGTIDDGHTPDWLCDTIV